VVRYLPSLLLLLTACAPVATEPPEVTLSLANAGTEPLRCQVIYAHWVTGDLPLLQAGSSVELEVRRDPATREVFVPRPADGRPLMLEEILCGLDRDWSSSLTHVDLEAIKLGENDAFHLTCRSAARVVCAPWEAR